MNQFQVFYIEFKISHFPRFLLHWRAECFRPLCSPRNTKMISVVWPGTCSCELSLALYRKARNYAIFFTPSFEIIKIIWHLFGTAVCNTMLLADSCVRNVNIFVLKSVFVFIIDLHCIHCICTFVFSVCCFSFLTMITCHLCSWVICMLLSFGLYRDQWKYD